MEFKSGYTFLGEPFRKKRERERHRMKGHFSSSSFSSTPWNESSFCEMDGTSRKREEAFSAGPPRSEATVKKENS